MVQLAIDCASDEPGVALAVDGVAGLMLTWETQRNHSRELLPNIERLLDEAGRTKADIDAIFVDLGPGGYAALRVGVSTAKALAHGLGVPIVGIGRLELDAFSIADESGGRRIIAVHRAGRGERAWAAYRGPQASWREEAVPRIAKAAVLLEAIATDDIITGDIDDEHATVAQECGAAVIAARSHRVVALAALGAERLSAGHADDAAALVPLYLRAPAIGPQTASNA